MKQICNKSHLFISNSDNSMKIKELILLLAWKWPRHPKGESLFVPAQHWFFNLNIHLCKQCSLVIKQQQYWFITGRIVLINTPILHPHFLYKSYLRSYLMHTYICIYIQALSIKMLITNDSSNSTFVLPFFHNIKAHLHYTENAFRCCLRIFYSSSKYLIKYIHKKRVAFNKPDMSTFL